MEYPKTVHPIHRHALAHEIMQQLITHQVFLIYGAAFRGKSWLIKNCLQNQFAKANRKLLVLDLFTLRKNNAKSLDLEAARWLFDWDEHAFQQFKQQHSGKPWLLHELIQQRLTRGDCLVLDHLARIPTTKANKNWLKSLVSFLYEQGILILFSERALTVQDSQTQEALRHLRPELQGKEIPLIGHDELHSWVSHQFPKENTVALVQALRDATGGSARLCNDFAHYYACHFPERRQPVEAFAKQASHHYIESIRFTLEALASFPEATLASIKHGSPLYQQLLLSGAFHAPQGKLTPISSIHHQRLQRTYSLQQRLFQLSSLSLQRILTTQEPVELLVLPLRRLLDQSLTIEHAFSAVRDVILRFYKVQTHCLYLGDTGHPLVWRQATIKSDQLKTLDTLLINRRDPHHTAFFRAIRSGAPAQFGSDQYLIPLVGADGLINALWCIALPPRLRSESKVWQRTRIVNAVSQLLQGLQAPIARHLEYQAREHEHAKATQLQRRIDSHTLRQNDNQLLSILHESRAGAVGVIKPKRKDASTTEWISVGFVSQRDNQEHMQFERSFLAQIVPDRLNKMADTAYRKGLVSNAPAAMQIFPMLAKQAFKTTLFLKPITIERDSGYKQTWIAIFAYPHQHNHHVITSYQQNDLSLFAQRLVEVSFAKYHWRRKVKRELQLLGEIGSTLSSIFSETDHSLSELLHALQNYFEVEAISVSDIQRCQEGHQMQDKVTLRRGLGYQTGYNHITYPLSNTPSEGLTGHVARIGQPFVFYQNQHEEHTILYYDHHGRTQSETQSVSAEYEVTTEYLASRVLKNGLFIPILWKQEGQPHDKVIGVLKMANRLRPSYPPYSSQKIVSAISFATLLAPVLYTLQQRARIESTNQQRSTQALLRGIDHELKHYIKDIRWTTELLSVKTQSPDIITLCDEIDQAAKKMNQRISDIRELVSIDAGQPVQVSLLDTCQQTVAQQQQRLQRDHHQHIPITCEGIHPDLRARIDADKFSFAIENLVRNACEALVDTPSPRIWLYTDDDLTDEVHLIIADNGPGIPASLRHNLFDPFVSGHRTTVPLDQPDRVRGVGLTLVRRIIEMAGGRIYTNRIAGETRFEVCLPKM